MLLVKHHIKGPKFSGNYCQFKYLSMLKYSTKTRETGIEIDKA